MIRMIVLILVLSTATAVSGPLDALKASGTPGGFVVHVGCGDGRATAALKLSEAYIVHGIDTDAQAIAVARRKVRRDNVSVAVFDGRHLPYIDNMVNFLYCSNRFELTDGEILRVLAPRGKAVIAENGAEHVVTKPVPTAYDEWHHYLRDPDNNAVSTDTAIRAPIQHLQWRGGPRFSRHHDKSATHMPVMVTARGRLFYIMDHGPRASVLWPADYQLVARDAFNGVVLWRRKIRQWIDHTAYGVKQGPADTPRRLVVIGDNVYVTLGLSAPVSKLDARTGEVRKVYAGTERTQEILVDGETMYLVVNPSVSPKAPPRMTLELKPRKVMAVREADGRILWTNDESWIAPTTMCLDRANVYVCTGPNIVAYNRKTGRRVWTSKNLPWREKMPTYFAPTLVATPGGVLYAGGENWKEHAGSKGLLTCLNTADGSIKWQRPHLPSGYQSPQDIFVIDGSAWCGSLNSKPGEFDKRYPDVAPSTGDFVGYNIESGVPAKPLPGNNDNYWFHHRCHRAKATVNYFLTSRTGIEMIDRSTGKWTLHHWIRSACLYGLMPANGMIYCAPHPCACYPEAKLSGFNAVRGPRPEPDAALAQAPRLVKGPAFGKCSVTSNQYSVGDWSTYRGNAARSGSTKTVVPTSLGKKWELKLGGKLSQPIVADGKVFVSLINQHTIAAVDQKSGKVAWEYVVGGRVDSAPTYYRGLLLFGCTDGHVYCLRASDGVLAWQFRAAPYDQRQIIYNQLESVWPVHGSVLIRNDVVYVTAGRSMFIDGGITLYRLNPTTGAVLSTNRMTDRDPETGKNLMSHIKVLSMPTASSDILSSEGKYVFMKSQPFDLNGKRTRVAQLAVNDQRGPDAHLFAANGMLDDSWWHRSFWQYGRAVLGGPGYGNTGKPSPAGKIMVLDDRTLYIFGRKPNLWHWTVPTEYSLFAVDRSIPKAKPTAAPAAKGKKKRRKPKGVAYARRWDVDVPILVRAMVKAGDTLFAAGPADVVDEFKTQRTATTTSAKDYAKQAALFSGADGSLLMAVSATDGKTISQAKLDVLPIFDGMIAAGGKLYMSTVDGKVICLGGK